MKTALFAKAGTFFALFATLVLTSTASAQWSTVPSSAGGQTLRGVYFRNATLGWFVGGSGLIRKTTNGGTAWTPQGTGLTSEQLNSVYFIDDDMALLLVTMAAFLKQPMAQPGAFKPAAASITIVAFSFLPPTAGQLVKTAPSAEL